MQSNNHTPLTTNPTAPLAHVVERNIQALVERQQRLEQQSSFQDRLADTVTRFVGSMRFVYLHLAIVVFWVVVNIGLVRVIPRFDPTFVILATVASVESIFVSTFILISQNRMQAAADKRSDLDLQVSLLAEHEVTRLVTIVSAMAQKMGIEESRDPELGELSQDIAPEKLMDAMDEIAARGSTRNGAGNA
jgi:uncharacterized membrane protein